MKKCDSRLTQVVDPTGTYSFTFDNMGRLTNTTTSYAFLTLLPDDVNGPFPQGTRHYGESDQCVSLTKFFTGLPCSGCWRAGPKVVGNNIPPGAAIATFDSNGLYPNNPHGNNSGIYVGPAVSLYPPNSILILDQWPGQNAQVWPLRPNAKGTSDRSTAYSVITVPYGTKASCGKCGNW